MNISPITRISFGLVLITLSVLLVGNLIGLIPDQSILALNARKSTAESLAVQCTLAARNNNINTIKKTMDAIVEMQPEVLSLGLRKLGGDYFTHTKQHGSHWEAPPDKKSTQTHWQIPIFQGGKEWGVLEISFAPLAEFNVFGWKMNPFLALILFAALVSFIGYLIFMKRTLRHLDPTTVMPSRVKYALDILTEGVVIVDKEEKIILANKSFCSKVDKPMEALMGTKVSDLSWVNSMTNEVPESYPWQIAIDNAKSLSGVQLNLSKKKKEPISFMANSAPILDNSGRSRGALATFDDITELEHMNVQLIKTLEQLEHSRDEVKRQNVQLEELATRDPLTTCLNRRAFFPSRSNEHR